MSDRMVSEKIPGPEYQELSRSVKGMGMVIS